ncbi:hypothetical protein A4A49_21319 [Nicotiana attenuata]|uniref:Uncharacterized protein n=1 Tax=Nicotiana attenuata TaxID=49451 RepID=A0A314KL30_NICAT|nr:hypothetical protein A4A49_21319 [Nicotiana attenuata]
MFAPTSQNPKLDLYHINQSKHQKHRPANRTRSRNQVPDPKRVLVDLGQVKRIDGGEMVGRLSKTNSLLKAQSNEARKEETAEGVHVEGDKILGNLGLRKTVGVGGEAVVQIMGIPS